MHTHMNKPTRQPFSIRNHDALGYWQSDDQRFFEAAILQLCELKKVTIEIKEKWPIATNETLRDSHNYPALLALVRKRDMLSDTVIMFSAMAVEGFLNLYGVVRLGEVEYIYHIEKLGLIPKIRSLLLMCDSLSLTESDPLVKALNRIAKRRNSLVHPKAKEHQEYLPAEKRCSTKIPETAQEAVADMIMFFQEFVALIPESTHLVPKFELDK